MDEHAPVRIQAESEAYIGLMVVASLVVFMACRHSEGMFDIPINSSGGGVLWH